MPNQILALSKCAQPNTARDPSQPVRSVWANSNPTLKWSPCKSTVSQLTVISGPTTSVTNRINVRSNLGDGDSPRAKATRSVTYRNAVWDAYIGISRANCIIELPGALFLNALCPYFLTYFHYVEEAFRHSETKWDDGLKRQSMGNQEFGTARDALLGGY
jgi:hypothetical protein